MTLVAGAASVRQAPVLGGVQCGARVGLEPGGLGHLLTGSARSAAGAARALPACAG